ncbi:MAG: hypothetical protein ACFE9I_10670 [Candidatus Hermodarchaeota archaeon]
MRLTNSEDQMWEMFDEVVKSKMIGTKGDLKRGWNEQSIMELREL